MNITTRGVNDQHTNANLAETELTPAWVSSQGNFVQLFSQPLDGQPHGQPLIMSNQLVNGANHHVVFVETQRCKVYAFDADTKQNALWVADLVARHPGYTYKQKPDSAGGDTSPTSAARRHR